MKLIIYTPERIILEKEITEVIVPTASGEITILPNHVNLLSTLSLGNIRYKEEDKSNEEFITIESGFLNTDGKIVKILADTAINTESQDEEDIERLRVKAKELMNNAPKDANLEKLKSQIRIAELHLTSKKRKKI